MSAIIQDNRPVKVYSVLGDNALLFCSLSGSEHISQLFTYSIEVASEDLAIDLDSLTGTDITIELELPLGGYRYYHGFISNSSQTEINRTHAKYQLIVRPWTWLLTRTTDCRIFQNMTVPEIISSIFDEESVFDYTNSLTRSYDPWEYCVQYRETDFNFVSRLMEQEGIYYYFQHENGTHKLILCDSLSAHEAIDNYDTVPFFPVSSNQIRERDHLSDWLINQNLQSGAYATNDYDFEDPGSDLLVKTEAPGSHAHANFEIYDYPGEYPKRAAGEQVADMRMEEIQAQHNVVSASGTAEGLSAGQLFTLSQAEREDQNQEYLIVESHSQFERGNFDDNSSGDTEFYCHIKAIPSSQPFRAQRITQKPIVQGPQTAMVVGAAGEEIWTDEHGRVKLQFHWDRYGQSDENSSCWIRVSQVHAGAGFGGIDIPRIGEEVIVEYLDGDPDRPIITGRVYNGNNKPPTELPSKAMVSGMKTNSTPGGGGYNQITMNDTKGEESMDIHAQHDQNTTVLNNDTQSVGANRTVTITDDFKTTVTDGNTEHDVATGTALIHVKGSVTENFDDTQTTTVGKDITVESKAGKVYVKAATSIKLETGASSIEMDAGGNISIKGVNVAIEGSATVSIAGGLINSEATGVNQTKGAAVISEGSASNMIKGGIVMLNP